MYKNYRFAKNICLQQTNKMQSEHSNFKNYNNKLYKIKKQIIVKNSNHFHKTP